MLHYYIKTLVVIGNVETVPIHMEENVAVKAKLLLLRVMRKRIFLLLKAITALIIDITSKLNGKISLRIFICKNMNLLQNIIK